MGWLVVIANFNFKNDLALLLCQLYRSQISARALPSAPGSPKYWSGALEHNFPRRYKLPNSDIPKTNGDTVAENDHENRLRIGEVEFATERPHRFGLVITGVLKPGDETKCDDATDYLHQVLLAPANRNDFFDLISSEGLVVCRNVSSNVKSYRPVRGKSSTGRLSQAEYFHHDGCSCPQKPRINEIRLPLTSRDRNVATAIARFGDVVRAQLEALPERLLCESSILEYCEAFQNGMPPPANEWDKIQGRVTRLIRREMDAESARAYFRQVDRLAGAFDLPWQIGESRLMLNDDPDLTRTFQHRRAYQRPKVQNEVNGSLVKRWTAEEIKETSLRSTKKSTK